MNKSEEPEIDENEWAAQERGMRAALGRDARNMPAAEASYRLIANTLASSPRSAPPENFASEVAEHIKRKAAGVEVLWIRLLMATFALAAFAAGMRYGAQWWQALPAALDAQAWSWILTAIGCATASWLFRQGLEALAHRGLRPSG